MRILVFAYACEPDAGSEPGTGWVWARMLARLGETWVITRSNNREVIEPELAKLEERDRLHFVYVDLPPWARFWKRGKRGLRPYYLLWQAAAVQRARRLDRTLQFDVAWHVTFGNAWLGSLGPLTRLPFVYGPVGGGVGVPWRLVTALGARGAFFELLRAGARSGGRYLNPFARLAWLRARLILVENTETRDWLPARHRARAAVFPNTVIDEIPGARHRSAGPRTALFVGRLVPWKGAALAIRAVASLPEWRLLVCGTGRDERRLRQLTARLGIGPRVVFLGTLARDDVFRVMQEEADVLIFPSLHDEGGYVVAEALVCGLPVLCLDRGGPPAIAGGAGSVVCGAQDVRGIVADLSRALTSESFADRTTIEARAQELTLEKRVEELRELCRASGLPVSGERAPAMHGKVPPMAGTSPASGHGAIGA
ncbi:MAG TPA: glycosyltransferase family 4 protein [Gaiellaceae bacterium]